MERKIKIMVEILTSTQKYIPVLLGHEYKLNRALLITENTRFRFASPKLAVGQLRLFSERYGQLKMSRST